jgi:hypothetical protein
MTTKYIVALILAAAAGSGFAAEQPKAQRADDTDVAIRVVDYPTAAFNAKSVRSRAEVQAEAVEAAKSHKSTLSEQFELLK